ncbi:hypothetical protein ACRWQM_14540 [Shewanella sp. HL-SH5]|uniref:hypothetical protein n=1 Tax=Shewanella sp. HL-SH5 TaxID=3436241 RepID=UPI003EBBEF16
MIPSKFKNVIYDVLPLSIAIGILLLGALGVGISMGLGMILNFIYDDPSAGGWTWIFAIPLALPTMLVSLPWSHEISSIGETNSIVVGVLINGFIGLFFWRIYLMYSKKEPNK